MAEGTPPPFDHRAAITHLSRVDRRLARLMEKFLAKSIEFRLNIDEEQTPYESLLRAIVFQSISTKAARVIFERVKVLGVSRRAAIAPTPQTDSGVFTPAPVRCPTPQELLRVRKSMLRKAGLSFAKIAAVRDLAQKTIEGIVPSIEEAHKMSDQELVDRLISVRGVGAWTVEMFLIFRLGRPDVLPIHDYGVQKGFAITYGKKTVPKPRDLAKFGERWRPYRTVASWYMWRAIDHAEKSARKVAKPARKKSRSLLSARARLERGPLKT
jgi:3-methyladenine DNA glycosylase/8-oxoguanine DNA glycosylase